MMSLAASTGHLQNLLESYGYATIFVIVGLECLGIPLPGEAVLTTGAIYAATTHRLSIFLVVFAAAAGAIIGDNIGFTIGRTAGYRILRRFGRIIRLDERRMKIGRYIFLRHGGKVVFFGRFVAFLRIYSAFLAGANRMGWRRFTVFNAAGGIVWASLVGFAFYFAGGALTRSHGIIQTVAVAVAIAVIVASLIVVRRYEARIAERAEAEFPGPLEAT